MAPGTEFPRDFCAGIGPLQLGVVLVIYFFQLTGSQSLILSLSLSLSLSLHTFQVTLTRKMIQSVMQMMGMVCQQIMARGKQCACSLAQPWLTCMLTPASMTAPVCLLVFIYSLSWDMSTL